MTLTGGHKEEIPDISVKYIIVLVRGTKNLGIKMAIIHMYKDGGLFSFWRGNGVNIIKITPEMATKFGIYHEFLKYGSEIYIKFVGGATAGFLAASLVYPLEVLKTRMALRRTDEFYTIMGELQHMYKHGGVAGLYKGYIPNIFGVIPYAGIELAVYETLKELFHIKLKSWNSTPEVLICGAVASFSGQVVVYPLGLIKTRMQSKDFEDYGFGNLVTQIFQNEGIRGFYRGLLPSVLRVLPSVMINFLVYEKTKAYLINSCNFHQY